MPSPSTFPAEVLTALESAFKDSATQIDVLIHKHGPENVKAGIRAYYMKHLAPIDIPYVPNALEPHVIDTPLMMALDAAFDLLHTKIHAVANPPAPVTPPA